MSLLLCGQIPGTYRSERLCDIEQPQALRACTTRKQPAAVANSIRHCFKVKLPICGSQIRRILRTQITVTLPPLWQAAVKDAQAAKRNKWRGPAQRGGGRLCRLRVSLKAACQSGAQRPRFFLAPNHNPKRSKSGISRAKPLPSQLCPSSLDRRLVLSLQEISLSLSR